LEAETSVEATAKIVYPLKAGTELVEGGSDYSDTVSPIWGPLSRTIYGFIVPGTDYFMAVGSHGGIHSGVGYKITQDDGNLCGGPCSYEASDYYNYFWLYNVNDIANASEPWEVKPVSYGKWSHPYDEGGDVKVLGAVYDDKSATLYVSLKEAGQVGIYDRPPLIIAYGLSAK
jgi:hypothetical protein